MNKQEENISDIITLDTTEEIIDIFLDYITHTDETVGIIANKELIEYAMSEALKYNDINARKVDLELDNDIEYMISIDDDGNLVVQPLEDYHDKYFNDMQHVYISMDGDITQTTIDVCLDKDMDVVLFGYEDEEELDDDSYEIDGKSVSKEEFDEYVSKFIKSDYKPEYHITVKGNLDATDAEKIIESMEHRMMHMQDMFDEMERFRRMFGW